MIVQIDGIGFLMADVVSYHWNDWWLFKFGSKFCGFDICLFVVKLSILEKANPKTDFPLDFVNISGKFFIYRRYKTLDATVNTKQVQ